jgi:hypothetical protein
MPKIAYVEHDFRADSLGVIRTAERICTEYARQGFILTLRQLYYQFVARGLLANKDTEYKRLGNLVNEARLAGLIDWDHLEDRTRNLRALPHWATPADIVDSCAKQFQSDLWEGQAAHVEAWIEKDALVGVIQGVCTANDVGYFSCRGYTSQSELWGAAQRLLEAYRERDKSELVVLHLGDHDPSGVDMTRDIRERLRLFLGHHSPRAARALAVERLALNMPQVEQYGPPPNPAKLTDSRVGGYLDRYGDESWELDALEPQVIAGLIEGAIRRHRDAGLWREALAERDRQRGVLGAIARQWDEVEAWCAPDGAEAGHDPDDDGDAPDGGAEGED